MAKQNVGMDIPMKASADLSTKQFYFVEQDATDDEISLVNAATDVVLGVLQDKPAADGREANVRIIGHTKVIAGETLTAGNIIGSNARGSATVLTAGTSTTAYAVGICTFGAASSAYAEAVIFGGISRAA